MDATFWVGAAFLVFILVLVYFKVPAMLTGALDQRAEKIRGELDDARQLREEAQALLANYERKQRAAVEEVKGMLDLATAEARREAEQAAAKLVATIARREEAALEKLALAEAQAEKEVREAAVDIAVDAATRVIARHVRGDRADALVDAATGELRKNLN